MAGEVVAALAQQIAGLDALTAGLDRSEPITVGVGDLSFTLRADVETLAYPEAAQAIRATLGRITYDMRLALADAAVADAMSALTPPEPVIPAGA
jgi:hypothetical protein